MGRLAVFCVTLGLAVAAGSWAAEPTEAERAAFDSAMKLYQRSQGMAPMVPPDPEQPPPAPDPRSPEELKRAAVEGFRSFLASFPESELCDDAQFQIGWGYFELGEPSQAKAEFQRLAESYPSSLLVDDARYQSAYIDFAQGDYVSALAGFEGVIHDYGGRPQEALTRKVPFAYFMAGECYRLLNDMEKARARFRGLIEKYPGHSQNNLAKKRLGP